MDQRGWEVDLLAYVLAAIRALSYILSRSTRTTRPRVTSATEISASVQVVRLSRVCLSTKGRLMRALAIDANPAATLVTSAVSFSEFKQNDCAVTNV